MEIKKYSATSEEKDIELEYKIRFVRLVQSTYWKHRIDFYYISIPRTAQNIHNLLFGHEFIGNFWRTQNLN